MSGGNYTLTPIGTADYPFCGTFDGNMANIRYFLNDQDSYTIPEMPTLFGVIGNGGTVRNINVDMINWDEKDLNGFTTKSAIIFKENNGTVENCHIKSGYLRMNGTIGSDYDFSSYVFGIGLTNNGTVKNCDMLLYYWRKYFTYPLNAIEINNGTVDDLTICFFENSNYNGIGDLEIISSSDDYQLHQKSNYPVGEQYEKITYQIDRYPVLCLTEPDENGVYHVTKPSELLYFVRAGKGEKVVLDNTIDLSYNRINREYTGSFTLDGTLTDETDVCSYIDLGTGTKCYGILNLSFENAVLSKGTINIRQDSVSGGLTLGVGTKIEKGVMSGTINYLKDGDSYNTQSNYAFKNVYYFGGGNGMNLTDISLTDVPVSSIGIFYDCPGKNCYNYGDIDINNNAYSYNFYVGNGVNRCVNFGNVNMTGGKIGFYGAYLLLSGDMKYKRGQVANSRNINFGEIHIEAAKSGSGEQKIVVYPAYSEQSRAYTGNGVFYETAKGNINIGDITVTADSSNTSAKPYVSVYGCYGGDNHGNISVSGFKGTGDNIVYGGTIANYSDIQIEEMKGKSLKTAGVFYAPKYNYEINQYTVYSADLKNDGTISVTDCEMEKDIECYAFNTAYLAANHYDITAVNTADITVNSCKGSNIMVMTFGNINNFYRRSEGQLLIDALGDSITVSDVQASGIIEVCGISSGKDSNPHTAILSNLKEISITDFSATNLSVYGLSALVDQYVDGEYAENSTAITVKNGTVKNNIKIYGIGQTVNTPAVNNGQITVSDIQKPTGTIMGQYQICGIGYQSNDSVLNNGNITIERIAPNDYSMTVVGCCINASSEQSRLVMNSGSIDLKETAPNTYISGVADNVTVGENTGLLLNTRNINVDITSNNILHCGGVTGSSTNERLLNAVNAGDITVIKGVSDETEIYGVGAAGDIQSVVNWGSITVTGLKDHAKNKVYAVGYGKSALCAWLNYGNVTVDLTSPHTALIGTVDFDGSVSDGEIIAGTGINYGTFNAAHQSGKGTTSQWYVDLSGRKEVIPSATWNYSTDPTAKNNTPWCKDSRLFRTTETSLLLLGYGEYDGDYVFNYDEMIQPSFGFIYNNPLATYYKNAAEKQEYNGENILDYAEKSELRGQTLAYLSEHYPDMAGGFCLNGSSILFDQTAGYLDADVEDCIDRESLPFRNVKISSRWGEKSVSNLFKNDLNQRDTGTTAKLSHYITMESVDEYETKSGSFEKIRNKTSLVPFQAPICGNLDTYITVAKLYAVTNEFKEIDGKTVPFILDVKGSKDITFRYFTDPVIYEDQQDMVRKVLHQFSDITYTGLEIPYSTENEPSVSLPIPESGQAVYALVGLAVSKNGKKTNALVIRLEAAGTTPKGWLTSLRYATGIDESQRGYVYESMLTNDEDSYTESNIYESTTNYTVTEAQQITESYGELTYPVYTMTKDMVHSSDGAYNPDGQYDWETNGIHTSSGVMTKFAVKNVDNYLIYVNDGSDYTGFIKGTMPDDHTTASENGIETIKYFGDERINIGYSGEKHLKNGTVDTEATDFPSFSNTYTYYYNPFMRGGEKTITVGTKSVSGEFIILFKIVINKEESNENYIKSKTVKRRDNLTRNEPAEEISKVDIQPKYFKDVYYTKYRADVSTLAKKGNPSPTNIYQDFVNAGETHYPAQVVSTIDVTAENGDTETYSHIYQFEKTEKLLADCIADSHDNVLAYGSNPFVMFDQDMNVDFSVYYRTYRDVSLNYCELYKTLVYVDGVLTDTVSNRWNGLYFSINYGTLHVYPLTNTAKEDLPDGIITIKPVVRLNKDGNTGSNEVFTLELDSFSFTKTLSKEHRALSVSWDKTLVTSAISTTQNDLSGDVDIFGDGSIDYSMTHDETNTFYITNTVKADCTGSEFSVRIPAFAKLQTYNGTDWVTVFTANNGTIYTTSFNYTFADLQRGYHYDFRVVAQAYAEDDQETRNFVSYYYTTITATTRNKDISIEFDSGNETMNLYREILADKGSTAIQIKNMNGDKAVLQQTKLYKGTSAGEMESTFYKLAQGDYAIDVQVPKGYISRVKIVGGSSEGYLNDSDVVKGKRIRLPYANEQSIRLVVYLTKDTAPSSWGVSYEKTLFHAARQNNI